MPAKHSFLLFRRFEGKSWQLAKGWMTRNQRNTFVASLKKKKVSYRSVKKKNPDTKKMEYFVYSR